MNLITLIYLADVSDGFCLLFFILGGIGLGASLGCMVEGKPHYLKYFVPLFLVCASVAALIPSKKTIYTIAAIKFGQEVIANPKAQVLEDKVYKIINEKLDSILPSEKKDPHK